MHVSYKKYIVLLILLTVILIDKSSHSVYAQDDSWQSTTTVNAPTGRNGYTTLWTGTEMIVWGGESGAGGCSLNTGGRYNPTTDTWTAMTTIGAPTMRRYHKTVWTGSEMIVWGGESCNGQSAHATGGRYNPATDTWMAMTTLNAPTGRVSNSAIWTGSEMIVWGGTPSGAQVVITNTGGRYNPTTDIWTPLSVSGAPPERQAHLAVWMGSEMID